MRYCMFAGMLAFAASTLPLGHFAQAAKYLDQRPLVDVIKMPVQDCRPDAGNRLPVIAWGADIATSFANGNAKRTAAGSIFAERKLDITLYRQDDFKKQVEDYLACKTPYLRGTVGMIAQAAEVLARDPRTAPVFIYEHSDSVGGDVLVVKPHIKTLADLCGKTVALQLYGPHVDLMSRVSADNCGGKPSAFRVKWVPDLLKLSDQSLSAAMAFHDDSSVDAAFVISPDASALTSGGKIGTGAEDSVKGAWSPFSTKTLNTVVKDVYIVRRDYFDAHRTQAQALVNGLMLAEERLRPLMKAKGGEAYTQMISAAAELLMDSKDAKSETEGMYADAELAGYRGNVKFFGDPNNPRGFDKLVPEVQQQLTLLELLSKIVPFAHAKWDYAALAVGLTDTANVELPRFDTVAVQQLVERRAKQGEKEGVLIAFEIYFGPNQNAFPAEQYAKSFEKATQLATTYGGALITVEGHSDPLGYLKLKKEGNPQMVLSQARQAAKNLSYSRANAAKDSVIAFAKGKGITLDPSQFGIAGYGVGQPNTPSCRLDPDGDISLTCAPATKQEWDASRRVVFKIINVEAETAVFKPL